MKLLPTNPLARLLGGYFLYSGTPLEVDEDEDNKHPQQVVETRDPIDVIVVGLVLETSQPLSYFIRKFLACLRIRS